MTGEGAGAIACSEATWALLNEAAGFEQVITLKEPGRGHVLDTE